jgi:hypothetical protein
VGYDLVVPVADQLGAAASTADANTGAARGSKVAAAADNGAASSSCYTG